jgi:hypothetical protein
MKTDYYGPWTYFIFGAEAGDPKLDAAIDAIKNECAEFCFDRLNKELAGHGEADRFDSPVRYYKENSKRGRAAWAKEKEIYRLIRQANTERRKSRRGRPRAESATST